MATIDDYLAALRQQKAQPIMQAWQKAKDALTNQQTQIQQEQAQKLPEYDTAKNGEDQQGWQQQQALVRRAMATGNGTSGELNTAGAVLLNGVNNAKMGIENNKQSYVRDVMNRMNQVKQGMQQADYEKDTNLAGLEGELGSTKAKYLMDQEASATSARRSSGGSTGSGKVDKNQVLSSIVANARQMFNDGYTVDDVNSSLMNKYEDLLSYGISQKDLEAIQPMINTIYSTGGFAQRDAKAKQLAYADTRGM